MAASAFAELPPWIDLNAYAISRQKLAEVIPLLWRGSVKEFPKANVEKGDPLLREEFYTFGIPQVLLEHGKWRVHPVAMVIR